MNQQKLNTNVVDVLKQLTEKCASLEQDNKIKQRALEKACEKLSFYQHKEDAEKLTDRMVELGIVSLSDKQQKVAELLKNKTDLSKIKMAVEHYNPNTQWGTVDKNSIALSEVKTSKDCLVDLIEYLQT